MRVIGRRTRSRNGTPAKGRGGHRCAAVLAVVALMVAATPGSRVDARTEAVAVGPTWTLDAAAGRAVVANAAGVVAVERYDGTHFTQHTWDPRTGEQRDLGTEGFTVGISATAVVVNSVEASSIGGNPFAVDLATSAVRPIQGLGGDWTEVRDVNDRGIVVGSARTPGHEIHAFAEDLTTGRVWDLAAAGPAERATAVSPSGRWVTGMASWRTAFRIDLETGAYDEVSDDVEYKSSVAPSDVNDDGLVVGYVHAASHGGTFTWAPAGGLEPAPPTIQKDYPVGLWGNLLLMHTGDIVDLASGETLAVDLSTSTDDRATDISEDGLVLLERPGVPGTWAVQLVVPPDPVVGLGLTDCRVVRWDEGAGAGSRAPSGWLIGTPLGTTVAVDTPEFDGPAPTGDRVAYSVVAVNAAGQSRTATVVMGDGCLPGLAPMPTTVPMGVVSPTFAG